MHIDGVQGVFFSSSFFPPFFSLFPGLVVIYILSPYMYTQRDLAGRWTGCIFKFTCSLCST